MAFLKSIISGDKLSPRIQRVGSEMLWVGVGNVLSVLGGLVGVRLLTHSLSPEAYGELALGMTAVLLAGQTIFGPLANAFMRFFAPAREAAELPSYLMGSRSLLVKASFVLAGVFAISFLGLLSIGRTGYALLLVLALGLSLLSGLSSSLDFVQNAARERSVVALHQGAGQWLKFLLAVLLIHILGSSSSVAMLGFTCAAAIVFVSQRYYFRRLVSPAIEFARYPGGNVKAWTEKMYSYAWPFSTWGIFTWLQLSSDRWALQAFSSTRDVGLFAAVLQVGYTPLILFSALVMQLISPILFSRAGDGSDPLRIKSTYRINRAVTIAMFAISMVMATIVYALHERVFFILVAPEYRSASIYLPVMTLSAGLSATAQIASQFLSINLNTRVLIMPKIITAVSGVVLNLAGAYLFGLQGVVVASLCFSLIYLVWMVYLTHSARKTVVIDKQPDVVSIGSISR